MNILGIHLGHDANAAFISEGRIVAVMEAERFFRQKRYRIRCLRLEAGAYIDGPQYVDIEDTIRFFTLIQSAWGSRFDAVAIQNQGRDPLRTQEYHSCLQLLHQLGFQFDSSFHADHHQSHAALGLYTSPFQESLILSYDGGGNDGRTIIIHGDRQLGLRILERSELSFGHSYNNLGRIIGIKPEICGTTAGKLMGLVSYGSFRKDWKSAATRFVEGFQKLPTPPYTGLNSYGQYYPINPIGLCDIPELQAFVTHSPTMGISMQLPGPESTIAQDLAYVVQIAWTEACIKLLEQHRQQSQHLCIVGGCALNGITNNELLQRGLFEKVHFVPNPADCGIAAGAALLATSMYTPALLTKAYDTFSPYLGTEAFDRADLPTLRKSWPHYRTNDHHMQTLLAQLLAQGILVAIMRGRYEIGPRALGNRSIFCTPFRAEMRDILNQKVKHREWYRPFAPIVPAEMAQHYFQIQMEVPYMSIVCKTRPEYRSTLPAVTHVDGTARVQTLQRTLNPFIYDLLTMFGQLTGHPVLLNTSLNPPGEPILNYYHGALDMLKTTDLDAVLIEDTLFFREADQRIINTLVDYQFD